MSDASASRLPLTVHALRLNPGDDLRGRLETTARELRCRAAFVLTCVGSLNVARLRFAGRDDAAEIRGDLEIVSLVGTLAEGGLAHLHLAVADRDGAMRGGHLLAGSIVRTTAEILLGEASDLRFTREVDAVTGYMELVARHIDR